MNFNINEFQKVADHLLQKHYGITINDTDMCENDTVALLMERGMRPYQAVADWAHEMDLVRVNRQGFYGVQSTQEITEEDEAVAIMSIWIWGSV